MQLKIIFIFLCALNLSAADYYVRKDGSDANAGTADNAGGAKLTLAGAAAVTSAAGDRVFVRAGVYTESFTESTSGSSGNFIQWIGDSTNTVTIAGEMTISGDYVRVCNFQITHNSNLGATECGVFITGDHAEVLNNHITETSGNNIGFSTAHYLVVRGNSLSWPGYPNGVLDDEAVNVCEQGSASNFVLIEYNIMSHNSDYINSEGGNWIIRNNVMGPISGTEYGGAPHPDGLQSNTESTNYVFEANWHYNNESTDAHMIITSSAQSDFWTVRRNVSIRSGDASGAILLSPGSDIIGAHNLFRDISLLDGGAAIIFYVRNQGGSGYIWKNNCFTNAPDTSNADGIFLDEIGGSLSWDHNIGYPYFTDAGGTDLNVDPELVAPESNDYRPAAGSPMIDAGGALTTTSGGGTSTTITVLNSRWFTDGMGIAEGDEIYVGNDNNLTVAAINYATHVITVNSSITWANGENVGYAYRGSGPDMGVYEFGDTLLTAATFNSGTVTPDGDTRKVEQYRDNVLIASDSTSPFNGFTHQSGDAYRVYSKHSQATMVFEVTEEELTVSTAHAATARAGTIRAP